MNRKIVLTILIGLALVIGAAGLGVFAFRAGAAYGLAQSEAVATALAENKPAVVGAPFVSGLRVHHLGFHPGGWGRRGWGWSGGFGFLGCLIPLFFLLLFFGLFRFVFRPWGWGWHGHGKWHGGPDVPPAFEEWHKRAHSGSSGDTPPPGNA